MAVLQVFCGGVLKVPEYHHPSPPPLALFVERRDQHRDCEFSTATRCLPVRLWSEQGGGVQVESEAQPRQRPHGHVLLTRLDPLEVLRGHAGALCQLGLRKPSLPPGISDLPAKVAKHVVGRRPDLWHREGRWLGSLGNILYVARCGVSLDFARTCQGF